MSLLDLLFPEGRPQGGGAERRRIEGLALYTSDGCLFCTRVLHAMARNGVDFELRDVRRDPGRREELIRGGGRSQVPCLRIETPQGVEWLYESGDIVRFLERYRELPARRAEG